MINHSRNTVEWLKILALMDILQSGYFEVRSAFIVSIIIVSQYYLYYTFNDLPVNSTISEYMETFVFNLKE